MVRVGCSKIVLSIILNGKCAFVEKRTFCDVLDISKTVKIREIQRNTLFVGPNKCYPAA